MIHADQLPADVRARSRTRDRDTELCEAVLGLLEHIRAELKRPLPPRAEINSPDYDLLMADIERARGAA